MIISLVGQEKNLGILTLTDHLLKVLGKENCAVFGWNYLITDYSTLLTKIKEASNTKNVIIKYAYPRLKFTNQEIVYPKILLETSDLVFRVPGYQEELQRKVPLEFFKGSENPIAQRIQEFYK